LGFSFLSPKALVRKIEETSGFEFHILAVASCLCLLFTGGGAFSIDRRVSGE
jgi:uncharacterized membrane protein YphA (DoxX/SURF4 family)